jgi:hypothetical protein
LPIVSPSDGLAGARQDVCDSLIDSSATGGGVIVNAAEANNKALQGTYLAVFEHKSLRLITGLNVPIVSSTGTVAGL